MAPIQFLKQVFNRKSIRVGWSMFWRVWLAVIVLRVAFSLPAAFFRAFYETTTWNPEPLRAHFQTILNIGGLLALVALILVFNWVGKSVLRKRGLPVPANFVGWALLWRGVGLSFLIGVPAGMLLIAPVVLWLFPGWGRILTPLFGFVVMSSATIFSYGWATLRISRTSGQA